MLRKQPSGRTPILLFVLLLALLAGACGDSEEQRSATAPLVVIGIDGAEWSVIEKLWEEGRLPNMKSLAERGTRNYLDTLYGSSPIIWTSIATGVKGERHGITDFVTTVEGRQVPVSSDVRKVPAIWNMLSLAGRRVAVLGWWATWPSEEIEGIVISDRPFGNAQRRVFPDSYLSTFESNVEAARSEPSQLRLAGPNGPKDMAIAYSAAKLASEAFDLVLVYFRSVDNMSHWYWKYWEPEAFPPISEEEIAAHRDRIPDVYEGVDLAIGKIIEAAGPEANILVISDHGFRARETEDVNFTIDLRPVLEELGYLTKAGKGLDLENTRVRPCGRPRRDTAVPIDFVPEEGSLPASEYAAFRDRTLEQLRRDFAKVTYESGTRAFRVRDPNAEEAAAGCGDLIVTVLKREATENLVYEGRTIHHVLRGFRFISGGHDASQDGIFIAAGPDINARADVTGINIFDITPTLLYGLGLPVAEDFDGRAWTRLFKQEFRADHELQTIPSWGSREAGVATSDADEALIDELKSLGYLN